MIPKVDSYVYGILNKYLPLIISSANDPSKERYIIKDALGGMESDVADTFINTFCKDSAEKKELEVSYAFPKQKSQADARYVISLGEMEEDSDYIGGLTGIGEEGRPDNEENVLTETVPVLKDAEGLHFELSKPILNLSSIDELSSVDNFIDKDKEDDDDNRVNLNDKMLNYVGKEFTITYVAQDEGPRKDYGGVDLGFKATEHVIVEAISNNLDTVRCMYALLKYILIISRSSSNEANYRQLQHISSSGLQIAQMSSTDLNDIVWVFPMDISYSVDYQIRNDSLATLDDISLERM